MKKIILINNGILPLPAVKGGAVEGLINLLIDKNEHYNAFKFEVFSIYDSEAIKESNKYNNTTFIYIKNNSKKNKLQSLFIRLKNFISLRIGGCYTSMPFYNAVIKHIQTIGVEKYAAILLEGNSINADYLKRKTGLPIIQRIHNTPIHNLKQFDKYNAQATVLYLGISHYICNCLYAYEKKYCPNIELLYNSIDFSLFKKKLSECEKIQLRGKLKIDYKDRVVMFSGRLREFKGIRQLLEAITLCEDIPNLKLLIVGSHFFSSAEKSPFEESLKVIIDKIKNKVIFTGYVPYKEIYRYYNIADVCAFPSTWEEPFGLTCLEALICGKPVIITQSGGMSEIVDNKCAIVVPNDKKLSQHLSDAIHSLLNNPLKCKEMEIAAFERAEKFNPDKQFRNFTSFINKYISL